MKYTAGTGKEVNRVGEKKEEKKESALPMVVMLITLGIALIVILKFILFSE